MESQEQSPGTHVKRPVLPEEQALIDELATLTEQYGDDFPHIRQYVQKEADRISKGFKSVEEERLLDIEGGKPIRLTYKVSIPTEKYPNFNYVGRIIGPKGSTLKGMQEISGCKLAVLGKGSMRDKDKEELCRKEGGKFAHLNEDLHVWIQSFGVPDMAFYKLYVACKEVKKYLHADYNDEIFNEQMMILEQEGGLPKGFMTRGGGIRGGGRGGVPRGMMSGRGGMPPGRGGMMRMSRGGRGGGGMMRGGAFDVGGGDNMVNQTMGGDMCMDGGMGQGMNMMGMGGINQNMNMMGMGGMNQGMDMGMGGMNHGMNMGMGGVNQGANMGMSGMNQGMSMGQNMGMGNTNMGLMSMGNMGQGMGMSGNADNNGDLFLDDEETYNTTATRMGMSSMKRESDPPEQRAPKFVRRY